MSSLECNKLFEGCDAVVEAPTRDEVLAQAAAHAKTVHGLENLDEATVEAVKAAIV